MSQFYSFLPYVIIIGPAALVFIEKFFTRYLYLTYPIFGKVKLKKFLELLLVAWNYANFTLCLSEQWQKMTTWVCNMSSLFTHYIHIFSFQNNGKLKTHLLLKNSNLNFITPKRLLYHIYSKMCWNLHLPLLTTSGYGFLVGKHSSNAMPPNWSVKEFIIKHVNMKIIYTIVSCHTSIFILTSWLVCFVSLLCIFWPIFIPYFGSASQGLGKRFCIYNFIEHGIDTYSLNFI